MGEESNVECSEVTTFYCFSTQVLGAFFEWLVETSSQRDRRITGIGPIKF